MKLSNFIPLLSLIFSTALSAQTDSTSNAKDDSDFPRVEFGFRFMPTVSAFSIETQSGGTVQGEGTFGYGIGGMLAFNFTKHFGVQAELMYNALSQKYKDEELDRQINVRYVNIPLLFSMNTGKGNPVNLNFVIGPQIGYNMGSSISKSDGADTDTITYVMATKRSDFGFAYGTGLGFLLNEKRTIRMDIGYRGVYGLTNITKNTQSSNDGSTYLMESAKVRTHSFYLGVAFVF